MLQTTLAKRAKSVLCFNRSNNRKKPLLRRKPNTHRKNMPNSNEMFNLGGLPNELSPIAKKIYDNLYRKNLQRQVQLFSCDCHGNPKVGLDFNKERDRCLDEKVLFEDPEFPAGDESLFMKIDGRTYPSTFKAKHGGYLWKRPGEIVANPRFVIADHSRFDVTQGILNDCCLSACASTLAMHEQLLYRVVPLDQSFTENYAGIFHFQFWHYGHWVDVVIDDRLPTRNNTLVFMKSEEKNEFWSALLEKAYAKLWGSYEAIDDGCLADIMEDMTGGIVENFQVASYNRDNLHKIIETAFNNGCFITCGITYNRRRPNNGLVVGHAYGVTSMAKVCFSIMRKLFKFNQVNYYGGEVSLIRIRNPWGNSVQWNGPFSDNAPEWDAVSEEERKKLLVVKDDGEFWMHFILMVWDDFMQQFTTVHVCLLAQESLREIRDMTSSTKKRAIEWLCVEFHGEWSARNSTAGGMASDRTFCNHASFSGNLECNPQYTVRVPSNESNEVPLIIEVMQVHEKETKGRYVKRVGFAMIQRERKLYKVEASDIGEFKDWILPPTFLQDRQLYEQLAEAAYFRQLV
uniref:Calpain catalytic domain-containing protein n=1 Tax=Syphacia muris TaxID=451379 RepID=A0A0N5AW74_9BILA